MNISTPYTNCIYTPYLYIAAYILVLICQSKEPGTMTYSDMSSSIYSATTALFSLKFLQTIIMKMDIKLISFQRKLLPQKNKMSIRFSMLRVQNDAMRSSTQSPNIMTKKGYITHSYPGFEFE